MARCRRRLTANERSVMWSLLAFLVSLSFTLAWPPFGIIILCAVLAFLGVRQLFRLFH